MHMHMHIRTYTSMSNLVRLLEKSTTLREFYYNKHVQELQNTISNLRATIAGQNRREAVMEDEHRDLEQEIENLRRRVTNLERHNSDKDSKGGYEVDFSNTDEYSGYSEDPKSGITTYDSSYDRRSQCYDRGRLCGMPFCINDWVEDCDCNSCRAKLCYEHAHEKHLVSAYDETDVSFYQCSMCQKNKRALHNCACIVCNKPYDPYDYDQFLQINDEYILGTMHCQDIPHHAWVCQEHNSYSRMLDALQEKRYRCPLC